MADIKLRMDETEPNDWTGERDKILSLYAQRYSQSYIAQAIGRSVNFVSKILHSEFQERNTNRQAIVEAHRQTLQWMIQKATKRIDRDGEKWDRRDGELLLKLLEREARTFGTDQPTQHNVTVEIEQYSDDELTAQLQQRGVVVTLPVVTPPAALPEPVPDAEFIPVEPNQEKVE